MENRILLSHSNEKPSIIIYHPKKGIIGFQISISLIDDDGLEESDCTSADYLEYTFAFAVGVVVRVLFYNNDGDNNRTLSWSTTSKSEFKRLFDTATIDDNKKKNDNINIMQQIMDSQYSWW